MQENKVLFFRTSHIICLSQYETQKKRKGNYVYYKKNNPKGQKNKNKNESVSKINQTKEKRVSREQEDILNIESPYHRYFITPGCFFSFA